MRGAVQKNYFGIFLVFLFVFFNLEKIMKVMNIKKVAKASAVALLMMTASAVMAQAGWEKAATQVTSLANVVVVTITVLCAAGGIGAIGYAGKLLMKKAGDRGEDVEWSKIGYAVLAGAFLLSVSFVATTTVETLGGTKDSIGTVIKPIGR